jgi:hypothetical protein
MCNLVGFSGRLWRLLTTQLDAEKHNGIRQSNATIKATVALRTQENVGPAHMVVEHGTIQSCAFVLNWLNTG